jgi:putative oxidoreductase
MSKATGLIGAIGRCVLAALFIWSGAHKLANPAGVMAFIGHAGLPFPPGAYAVSLICELGGGSLLAVGYRARAAAVVLAVFSLTAGVSFHRHLADMNELVSLFKDFAIAGGLLQFAAFGAGPVSVDAMLESVRPGRSAALASG